MRVPRLSVCVTRSERRVSVEVTGDVMCVSRARAHTVVPPSGERRFPAARKPLLAKTLRNLLRLDCTAGGHSRDRPIHWPISAPFTHLQPFLWPLETFFFDL